MLPHISKGGEVDEDRLEREIGEQRSRDQAQGRQRAVKHKRRKTRESSSASSKQRSESVETDHPSDMDWLPVIAPDSERQRCGSVATDLSEPQEAASLNDCLSLDPISDDAMRSMAFPGPSQIPRMSSLFRDIGTSASPSQWAYPYTFLLTPSRAFEHPFSNVRQSEGEPQDLLHKIQRDSFDFELQSPPHTFNTNMAVSGSQWTDPVANKHDDFDPMQLSHLLNDESRMSSARDSGSSDAKPRIHCKFWLSSDFDTAKGSTNAHVLRRSFDKRASCGPSMLAIFKMSNHTLLTSSAHFL